MTTKIILKEINDWSQINKMDPFWSEIDLSRPDINFGIHTFNGELWTSGYVGVGRIYDKRMNSIKTKGNEHVVVINSQYGMDPWNMLEKVITDEEYDSYQEELKRNNKCLYRVFYDEPIIKLEQDQKNSGDLLFALSFINSCYSLCKKGIKKKMFYKEENYNAKIRGKIDVKKNIRINTSHGRNDRFYCKYIDFTSDNIENRILKATLIRCKKIVEQKFEVSDEILRRTYYCMNSFRNVKNVHIRNKDFNNVSVSGLYTYYKPLLQQARCILAQKYKSFKADNGKVITKSIYTIPYMINMEAVFEFYTRIVMKNYLAGSKYYVDSYSKKLFLENGVSKESETKKGIHLMTYCIPDIIIRDSTNDKAVVVLDAKYKAHDRSSRLDSHQLLSYVILTGANRCGFIFPGTWTEVKHMRSNDYLELQTPLLSKLNYYELILSNELDHSEIDKIFV